MSRFKNDDDKTQSEELVEIALNNGEVFTTPDHEPHIMKTMNGRMEVFPLASGKFRTRLCAEYMDTYEHVPNAAAVGDAINVLRGLAARNPLHFDVRVRVGEADNVIYIDLANDQREIVAISAGGWNIVRTSSVRFKRPSGMLPLPRPARGGSIESLRQFLNFEDDKDFLLIVAWLLAALRPTGPFAVLVLCGEAGSAKSTASRVCRALIDPNLAALRGYPHEMRDLMVAANNGWVLGFDNISKLPPWLSDALCRIATGGGFAKRQNYTDLDEVLVNVQRPIIINGIEEMITRGDLIDRSIVLNLPSLSQKLRKTERELERAFEAERPRILGVLLDGVATGLSDVEQTSLKDVPRMADFTTWAAAALPGVGFDPDAFQAAYSMNLVHASETAIDASPIGRYIRDIAHDDGGFRSTAKRLLDLLNQKVGDEGAAKHWGWPHSPLALANSLRRLAPAFLRQGIEIQFGLREGRTGDRIIIIRCLDQ